MIRSHSRRYHSSWLHYIKKAGWTVPGNFLSNGQDSNYKSDEWAAGRENASLALPICEPYEPEGQLARKDKPIYAKAL